MIKMNLTFGKLMANQPQTGIDIIAIDTENKSTCNVLIATPKFNKVSKKNMDELMQLIEDGFNQCVKGLNGSISTTPYEPPIARAIRENLKDYFEEKE